MEQVIGLQWDLAWEDPAANAARATSLLDRAAPAPGSLVVLPEMFSTGFTMNPARAAEPLGGPSERWLGETARRGKWWMIAGVARRDASGAAANEALVLNPEGQVSGVYRKQRVFRPGGEHDHYQAGDQPLVFRWGGLSVAVFICYDLRFPELFRVAARQAPELFVVIASWPDKRVAHWLKLLQARAIENQAYVLGVNRVGQDPTHHYPGRSVLVSPWGDLLADAGEGEGTVGGRLDLGPLREYRQKLPFLADL